MNQLPTTTNNGAYNNQQGEQQQQQYQQPQQQVQYQQPAPNNYNMMGQPIGGYQAAPNGMQIAIQHASMLSQDDLNYLVNNVDPLDLAVTRGESIITRCDHLDHNTGDMLTYGNPDGTCTCTRCGSRFRFVQGMTPEKVKEATDNIVDIIETIKVIAPNMPVDAARQFFTILALIKKVPRLFDYAVSNFRMGEKNENKNNGQQFDNNAGIMQLFGQITGGWNNQAWGGANPYGQQQQPVQPQWQQFTPQQQQQQQVDMNVYPADGVDRNVAPAPTQEQGVNNNGFAYNPNTTTTNSVPTGNVAPQQPVQQQAAVQAEYSAPAPNAAPAVNTPAPAKKTSTGKKAK